MLDSKNLENIVFADIETTSQYPTFKSMPEKLQEIFKRRYKKQFAEIDLNAPFDVQEIQIEEFYSVTAPLQPEWGRILCISIGTLSKIAESNDYSIKVTSYSHEDEKILLNKFINATASISTGPIWKYNFCFHNGTTFDVPYIAKRIILNEIPLPKIWDFGHLKPWERTMFIDTKTVWRMDVYDNQVSLDHLAYMFGLDSSKDEMEGSDVKDEFWVKHNLSGITTYCEKDVVVLAQIYLKIKGMKNKVIKL